MLANGAFGVLDRVTSRWVFVSRRRVVLREMEHAVPRAAGMARWPRSCARTRGARTGCKLHTRTAADLAPAYERWPDFAAVRDRVDPPGAFGSDTGRLFGNAYLDRVLG